MWSTWCSVLTRYWIGPWPSTTSRHSTAFDGSCGVSIMTGPFDVTTNDGLQPRTRVSVQVRAVTCSMARTSGELLWLLRRGEAAVDADHLSGDESGGIRGEEDHGADEVVRLADAAERDPSDDAGLERRIAEEHRDLRGVDERRPDRVDADAVACPLGRPLAGQRFHRALGRDVRRVAGVDAQLGA